MVGAGAKNLLENGNTKALFFISVYILSVGAGKHPPYSPDGAPP
jgi:hypothetical protein